MARTTYGNLTGKAGATEKAELREQLWEVEEKRLEKERESRRRVEVRRERELMRACIELEGYEDFCRWWEDDEQVPPHGKRRERLVLLENRLSSLRDHKQIVVKEEDDGKKSQ